MRGSRGGHECSEDSLGCSSVRQHGCTCGVGAQGPTCMRLPPGYAAPGPCAGPGSAGSRNKAGCGGPRRGADLLRLSRGAGGSDAAPCPGLPSPALPAHHLCSVVCAGTGRGLTAAEELGIRVHSKRLAHGLVMHESVGPNPVPALRSPCAAGNAPSGAWPHTALPVCAYAHACLCMPGTGAPATAGQLEHSVWEQTAGGCCVVALGAQHTSASGSCCSGHATHMPKGPGLTEPLRGAGPAWGEHHPSTCLDVGAAAGFARSCGLQLTDARRSTWCLACSRCEQDFPSREAGAGGRELAGSPRQPGAAGAGCVQSPTSAAGRSGDRAELRALETPPRLSADPGGLPPPPARLSFLIPSRSHGVLACAIITRNRTSE